MSSRIIGVRINADNEAVSAFSIGSITKTTSFLRWLFWRFKGEPAVFRGGLMERKYLVGNLVTVAVNDDEGFTFDGLSFG